MAPVCCHYAGELRDRLVEQPFPVAGRHLAQGAGHAAIALGALDVWPVRRLTQSSLHPLAGPIVTIKARRSCKRIGEVVS